MNRANRYIQFITPLGGIFALTCFFMPWLQIDVRVDKTTSGFGLLQDRVLLAIAFAASLVVICVSLYMVIRRTPWKSKVPILMSTGIGLAVLWPEYINCMRMNQEIPLAVKFGFWGAVVGFVVATVGAFLTRTKSEEQSRVSVEEEEQLWSIVHIGGIFALICFFIPWEEIGAGIAFSGIDLARRDPLITIALIASATIVGASFYMLVRGTLWKARVPVLVSIGIGIGVLLAHYVDYFNMLNNIKRMEIEVSANTLEFGLWGAVLGFVVAAAGVFLISRKNTHRQVGSITDMEAIKVPPDGKTVT